MPQGVVNTFLPAPLPLLALLPSFIIVFLSVLQLVFTFTVELLN